MYVPYVRTYVRMMGTPTIEWLPVALQPTTCAIGALVSEVWTSYLHCHTPTPHPRCAASGWPVVYLVMWETSAECSNCW